MRTKNLERYRAWLAEQNQVNPGWAPIPAEFQMKTLWIPYNSENRTSHIDLNHTIDGWENDHLVGLNSNCGTLYQIIEVDRHFDEFHLGALCALVAHQLGLQARPCLRDALTVDRLPLIHECLRALRMSPADQ